MKNSSINHLAIIMDGNGRWANQKNKQRVFGHEKGAQTAKKIINDCVKRGHTISYSVYFFKRKLVKAQA